MLGSPSAPNAHSYELNIEEGKAKLVMIKNFRSHLVARGWICIDVPCKYGGYGMRYLVVGEQMGEERAIGGHCYVYRIC